MSGALVKACREAACPNASRDATVDWTKYKLVVFDLDGVIVKTPQPQAWRETLDGFLEALDMKPFDLEREYLPYFDGRPSEEGTCAFLKHRGIVKEDPENDDALVWANEDIRSRAAGIFDKEGNSIADVSQIVAHLKNKKQQNFRELSENGGVKPYESTVALIRNLKREGIAVAVLSSSTSAEKSLARSGSGLKREDFDAFIDGNFINEVKRTHVNGEKMPGKPAPDALYALSAAFEIDMDDIAFVGDAVADAQAAREAGVGTFVGLARADVGMPKERLLEAAEGVKNIVVAKDLEEIRPVRPTENKLLPLVTAVG